MGFRSLCIFWARKNHPNSDRQSPQSEFWAFFRKLSAPVRNRQISAPGNLSASPPWPQITTLLYDPNYLDFYSQPNDQYSIETNRVYVLSPLNFDGGPELPFAKLRRDQYKITESISQ